MTTDTELSEEEKESDRIEADKYLPIIDRERRLAVLEYDTKVRQILQRYAELTTDGTEMRNFINSVCEAHEQLRTRYATTEGGEDD